MTIQFFFLYFLPNKYVLSALPKKKNEVHGQRSTFFAKMLSDPRPHPPFYNDGARCTTTLNLRVVKFSFTVGLNETKVAVC